jgi:hypothetical protein
VDCDDEWEGLQTFFCTGRLLPDGSIWSCLQPTLALCLFGSPLIERDSAEVGVQLRLQDRHGVPTSLSRSTGETSAQIGFDRIYSGTIPLTIFRMVDRSRCGGY